MKAVGGAAIYMTPTDLAIKWDAELLAIAQVRGRRAADRETGEGAGSVDPEGGWADTS
jgi:hypothetical protein